MRKTDQPTIAPQLAYYSTPAYSVTYLLSEAPHFRSEISASFAENSRGTKNEILRITVAQYCNFFQVLAFSFLKSTRTDNDLFLFHDLVDLISSVLLVF